jgi:hypothetical protein
MATYTVWARKRPVRPIAWLCGPEWALVRDVLSAYDAVAPGQAARLHAGDVPERDIWDELLSDPPLGGRLAVVHGAEKLAGTHLVAALAAEPPGTAYTVFVSAEEDFPRAAEGGKKTLAPHLAALQASRHGQLVRCCRPARDEDVLRLVASWWPGAGSNLAFEVLGLCGGGLTEAWQSCDKAVRAGLDPTSAHARLVCPPGLGPSLADRLIAGDKPGALAQARQAGHRETGRVLGLLASRLAALAEIGERKARGQPLYPVGQFQVHLLARHAGAYPPERITRLREHLARCESWWRAGATEGIAESLVSLW